MTKLSLYSIFHLNLAYSSITEVARPEVIKHCYWPLLNLAEDFPGAIALEVTGYTLEQIAQLDPNWVSKFRALIETGVCELIGSGYCQIIGPLVPASVNTANLRLGMEIYETQLGCRPTVALINELSYSAGLIPLYCDAGYRAVIMEWNNAAVSHPNWSTELEYEPQRLHGLGCDLPVIWIDSKASQYFQHFVRGDETYNDYLAYLTRQISDHPRAFSLYGSDTEVFDFRPRRYENEEPLPEFGEWARIHSLFETLQTDTRFIFTTPSYLLKMCPPSSTTGLTLETPAQPIIVKKQAEYNLVRWGLTGLDSLGLNTACYCLEQSFSKQGATDKDWRCLCYFWSSDFRTHISKERFDKVKKEITKTLSNILLPKAIKVSSVKSTRMQVPSIIRNGHLLTVTAPAVTATFNLRRGLAIESLVFPILGVKPVLGRLPLGFFGNFLLDSDFHSGHTVIELPGRARLKDLKSVEPVVEIVNGNVHLQAIVVLPIGTVTKEITIEMTGAINLQYDFALNNVLPASIRTGIISINPKAFALESIGYEVANGGRRERFKLSNAGLISSEPLSLLVSARNALGNTDGHLLLFDKRTGLELIVDPTVGAALPMLHFQAFPSISTYLLRVFFSLAEIDDTNRYLPIGRPLKASLALKLKPVIL
ncbi:MAG: glycoside hydrolase family 57 [Patescibacteria group bacterium]